MEDTPVTINGMVVIGIGYLPMGESDAVSNAIASIFPDYRLIIAGSGIHCLQLNDAADYLRGKFPDTNPEALMAGLCRNAVPLHIRGNHVIIRTDPCNMEKALASDELLQKILPKGRIRFTGQHLAAVRNVLRLRGEIWRIAPAPVYEKDYEDLIRRSRVSISTGTMFFYNKHTGEHFLTYSELLKIRRLLRHDKAEAAARLREIVELSHLVNNHGYPELRFFIPSDHRIDILMLEDLLFLLENTNAYESMDEAEARFDQFLTQFAAQAGPGLTADDPACDIWRATALCRLYNIDEKTTAEWSLGLGPEFYLHIKWLPGGRICGDDVIFEPDASHKVKSLIQYYRQNQNGFTAINVGSIVAPLTRREKSDEAREVYIVSLSLPDGRKKIRHIRMSKWDVLHRIKKGESLEQAISETRQYRDYIVDRLTAACALGLPIPVFREIDIEDLSEFTPFPIYYFEREYIPGIVTDKIPSAFYARKGFLPRLAYLLGKSAAACLVLGRSDARTGQVFFDDGDELIQLDENGLPDNVVMIETTGSFNDWTTPVARMLSHCLFHLSHHLEKARDQGAREDEIESAIHRFAKGLIEEIQRMQRQIDNPQLRLSALFIDRTDENGGIRNRWNGILARIRETDTEELQKIIYASPHLEFTGKASGTSP